MRKTEREKKEEEWEKESIRVKREKGEIRKTTNEENKSAED